MLFFSGVPGLRGRKHLRGVHRCGALLPCKSTRAISRQTSAAVGTDVLLCSGSRSCCSSVSYVLCLFVKKTLEASLSRPTSFVGFFRSGGESDDSARGGATCVILGTSVTTATTYSAIDEALSPCMLHLVDSVFEVVICLRSVSVHSSDCHEKQPCAASGGKPFRNAKFFVCDKESICQFCFVVSLLWPCPGC